MSTQSIRFERILQAPASEVYHALTNSSRLREWMSDVATTDPKPNGRIYMAWFTGFYGGGHFTALEKDKLVAYTWHGRGEPHPTQVTISLSPEKAGTRLELVHSELGEGPDWEQVKKNFNQAWDTGLENLESALETGRDLRIVNRPMLGVLLDDFNPEIAKKIGVPVSEGVRLSGTVDGMGAQAAGLQANDVLVRVGKVETKDYNTLGNIIGAHKAGEVLEVEFYRGAEKKTASMKLSGRPIPKIPPTIAAMAKQLKKTYNRKQREILAAFKGYSEEEASHKPSPDEWSAKEVLAHLIHGERGWQSFLQDMVVGYEPHYDDGGNLPERIAATLAAFPTTQKLLAELKALLRESVALVGLLPESFVQRKSTYWRLGYIVTQSSIHLDGHLEQIKKALQAARG